MPFLWKSTKMFREIGYKDEKFDNIISFYKHDSDIDDVCISFDLDEKTVSKYRNGFAEPIALDEYKCIEQKIKELHWLDYRPSFPKKSIESIKIEINKESYCVVLHIRDEFGVYDAFVHYYIWRDLDDLRVSLQNKYEITNSGITSLCKIIQDNWDKALYEKPLVLYITNGEWKG